MKYIHSNYFAPMANNDSRRLYRILRDIQSLRNILVGLSSDSCRTYGGGVEKVSTKSSEESERFVCSQQDQLHDIEDEGFCCI